MPRHNDRIELTDREWEQLMDTIEFLNREMRRMSDEYLVFKAKLGVVSLLGGALAGLTGTVATHFVIKLLAG